MPVSLCFAQENEDYDPIPDVLEACQKTLKTWNDALNTHDEDMLSSTYFTIVDFYQSYYTKDKVDKSHSQFFKKNPNFHQYYDNVEVVFCNGCQAQFTFDKHVQTTKDGPYTTYTAYLHFLYQFEDGAFIIGESDATTDANLMKRQKTFKVSNDMSLDEIFCEANVGKTISASYWDLVEMGDKEDGPLATLILTSGFPRSFISGVITKDYDGQKGTYSCGGYAVGGECQAPVIYTYNAKTKEMHCISGEEEE